MAKLNGQTPEEIAEQIIESAVEDKLVTVQGTTHQKLMTVVRYANRDKIQARGSLWFAKNEDALVADTITDLIVAREKAITSYLNKKELQEKDELFRDLVARGIAKDAAYAQAYN